MKAIAAPASRARRAAIAGFQALMWLAACGGGGAGNAPAPSGALAVTACAIPENQSSCQATIAWTTTNAAAPALVVAGATVSTQPSGSVAVAAGAACRRFATRTTLRAPTPFVENGVAVELEVVLYSPPGMGPFPTVMFNHGSTGNGSDPSLFTITFTSESVARFFAERGWLTAFPQRRGRGASGGLYDEGFTPNRSGYSCEQAIALAGATRALADLDAAVDWLRARAEVDATRMLAAGFLRGGILAVAHVARRPEVYRGAVNFVGGWLGEGCGDFAFVNRTLFEQGAAFQGPSIWLYAENDSFYSLAHSQANFDAFVAAGGTGQFRTYLRAPGLNGHFLMNDPGLWVGDLEAWLATILPP